MGKTTALFKDIQILSRGVYLQIGFQVKLLDNAVIRSNEPEEVLSYHYKALGNRFIIPWRKFKGKLRRLVMEQQRNCGIAQECHLKAQLCMVCPACFLFGGTGETSTAKTKYNLLSRVLGETLISTGDIKDIEHFTAIAVDEKTIDTAHSIINNKIKDTGGALLSILTVPAETEFIGIVTLRDPTPELTAILADNLNRMRRLGASTREWGRCKVSIVGYRLSDREDVSVYEVVKDGWRKGLFEKIEKLKLPSDIKKCYKDTDRKIKDILKKL